MESFELGHLSDHQSKDSVMVERSVTFKLPRGDGTGRREQHQTQQAR